MHTSQTQNLWFWPKRPPSAFSEAETSVAEMSRPKRPRPKCPWPKCPSTDACLTADPGVASSIPARSHTFVEIDHEIISTVILLPSADSFKKGCCQLQAKVCAQITG